MAKDIKIACLPVAGIGNPYQFLMMEGLNEDTRLHAFHGSKNRLIGILITAIRFRPTYIHFDWIESLYARRNKFLQYINTIAFVIQILIVRHILCIPLVCTLHNIRPHDSSENLVHQRMYRFFLKNTKWIRVFSREMIQDAGDFYRINQSHFLCIPEGDFTSYYLNTSNKQESRKFLNIDQEKLVLLFFGNLRPYKGLEALIEAFKEIGNKHALLLIAGNAMDKAYSRHLQTLISENIILHAAFISPDAIQYYFNACDIVVLPFTKIDNSGSAILAMGFKSPIVAPSMGAVRSRLALQKELLYEENGLLSKLNYTFQLSEEQRNSIGEENYRALKKYTWGDFASAFE